MRTELQQRYKELVAMDSKVMRSRCSDDAQRVQTEARVDEATAQADTRINQLESLLSKSDREGFELESTIDNLEQEHEAMGHELDQSRAKWYPGRDASTLNGATSTSAQIEEMQRQLDKQHGANLACQSEVKALGEVETELRQHAAQCVVRLAEEAEHFERSTTWI